MADKYGELEARASAPVTQGKWREVLQKNGEIWVVGDGRQVCACQDGRVSNAHDAAYIAAAAPDVVLGLIAELRAAKKEVEHWRLAYCRSCESEYGGVAARSLGED